ncbi:MAG: fluoride efflux transporter CrcB [Bacteroidales bacterium]|nr:fluoride efflux transporter CrcB [Bacteroidales bacterium]
MEGLLKLLLIAAGGGIGASIRYLMSMAIPTWFGRIYLWGTLSVNILGSFLIGLAWAYFAHNSDQINLRLFLIVGLLGGFTTYSSFSLEVLNLFKNGHTQVALLYILATNTLAIGAAFAGYYLLNGIFKG